MSNTRFVNKGLLKADLNNLNALIKHFENGGTIQVLPAQKRPKRGYATGKSINVKG